MAETCSVVLARFAAELEYTKIPADVVRALPRATLRAIWEAGLRFDTLAHVTEFTRFLSKS